MVEIRRTSEPDPAQLGRVHAASRGSAYAGLVPDEALRRVTAQTQERVWRHRLADAPERSVTFVAEDDGRTVGFTHGVVDGSTAELVALHVLPETRGRGVGQALHDALLDELGARGCTDVELSVLRDNVRAQAFYRRNGWATDGTTRGHDVGGTDVPVLRYTRSL